MLAWFWSSTLHSTVLSSLTSHISHLSPSTVTCHLPLSFAFSFFPNLASPCLSPSFRPSMPSDDTRANPPCLPPLENLTYQSFNSLTLCENVVIVMLRPMTFSKFERKMKKQWHLNVQILTYLQIKNAKHPRGCKGEAGATQQVSTSVCGQRWLSGAMSTLPPLAAFITGILALSSRHEAYGSKSAGCGLPSSETSVSHCLERRHGLNHR